MKTRFAIVAVVLILGLSLGAGQLSWAAPPPSCPAGAQLSQCIPGAVVYFIGKQNFDQGFNGFSTSILAGEVTTNLGGPGAGFIDDDLTFGSNYGSLHGHNWNVTASNAAYLGSNPSEVAALTKFGSNIGVNGYAELANLASLEFQFGARDSHSTLGAATVIAGYMFAANVTYPSVSQALNEAIYWIANQGNGATCGGANCYTGAAGSTYTVNGTQQVSDAAAAIIAYELTTFGAKGGSSQAAIDELKKDIDIWFLNGGSGKPELILQYHRVPEGGDTLAFLFLAGLPCLGAMAFFRKRITGSHAA